ncbi:rod shape-determining protein MreD [bacterium]|nr:MAG: rod shape-determining protein MreD [bacterium]
MRYVFLSLLFFILSVVADFLLSPVFRLGTSRPEFLLLFVYFISLYRGRWYGLVYGFLSGFLLDLHNPESLGIRIVVFTSIGYFLQEYRDRFYRYRPTSLLLLFGASIFYHFFLVLFSPLPFSSLFTRGLPSSLLDLLFAYPVFLLILLRKSRDEV